MKQSRKKHKTLNFPVLVAAGIIKLVPRPTTENPEATEKEIVEFSGFAQLDFDGLKALGLDPRIVRDQFAKLRFVAYSGLSVRGGGVWLLVFLDAYNMETYTKRWKACFEFCYSLLDNFLGYKVIRDTKGTNSTDYRFIAPDSEGKWNLNPESFTITLKEKLTPKNFNYSGLPGNKEQIASYIQNQIIEAPDGNKHETLRRLSFWAGGLVAGNQIGYEEAYNLLFNAITRRQLDSKRNAEKTIRSGLQKGAEKPLCSTLPAIPEKHTDSIVKGAIDAFEAERTSIQQVRADIFLKKHTKKISLAADLFDVDFKSVTYLT